MKHLLCRQCGKDSGKNRYCSERCKWTWHNRNRTLTPNVRIKCAVCGKKVVRWVSPQRLRNTDSRYCSRKCAGKQRRGEGHPNWTGGRQTDKSGYVLVYAPEHPHANKAGYVREHRLVMEKHIGRYLRRREVVHHINEKESDNRIENLRLYPSNRNHKADDYKRRKIDHRGRLLPKKGKKDDRRN